MTGASTKEGLAAALLALGITALAVAAALVAPVHQQLIFPLTFITGIVVSACLLAIRGSREHAESTTLLAYRDDLTGLPNRRSFTEKLWAALSSAHGSGPALLILDLDRFKVVNDTLGHLAGDQLLKAVSQRLQDNVDDHGFVARLGGDEFAIVAAKAGEREARDLADRILRALDQPVLINGQSIWPNASIGLAMAGRPKPTPQELFSMADVALYQAKERGKGRYCVYEAHSPLPSVRRLSLESELRTALSERQLEMYYQPIMDLETMTIRNVEALIRWNHPTLGLLTPDKFLALADETGISRNLAEWVMTEVCQQATSWDGLFGGAVSVSVNLSALQFRDLEFIPQLQSVLSRTGADNASVNFEVTESVFMDEQSETHGNLEALRGLGFKVAIDDFGVGYSSLSYLRRFNVDILKIDQSFVQDTHQDKALPIIQSVVQLAHTLGITTVAEGVETQDQLECMKAAGCDAAQGYLIAEPLSATQLTELLAGKGQPRDSKTYKTAPRANAALWKRGLSDRWVHGDS